MVVDDLKNIDTKFPKSHDLLGVEKPQWVIDKVCRFVKNYMTDLIKEKQDLIDEEDTNEGIVRTEL